MSTKRIIARNTTAQIIAKAVSSATTLLVTLIIAHMFGAAGFGEFTKITAYVGFFYLLADFGLNALFVLVASDTKDRLRRQFSSFLLLRLLLGVGLVVVLLLLLPFIPGTTTAGFTKITRIGIALFSMTVIAQAIVTTTNAFFQKILSYQYHTLAVSIGSVVTVVLIFFASIAHTVFQSGVLLLVGLLVIGWIVMAATAVWFVHREIQLSFSSIDWQFIQNILSKGWVLGVVLFATVVTSQSSRLILSITRETTEVGIYGLAHKFFEFPLTLPIFFINSMYPLLIRDKNTDKLQLRRRLQKTFGILFVGGVGISVVLYAAAPFLALIKSDFAASVPVFQRFVVFLPVFFMSALVMWIFILFDQRKILLFVYTLFAVLHVGTGIAYIPRYGAYAAVSLIGLTELGILLTGALVLYQKRDMLYDTHERTKYRTIH